MTVYTDYYNKTGLVYRTAIVNNATVLFKKQTSSEALNQTFLTYGTRVFETILIQARDKPVELTMDSSGAGSYNGTIWTTGVHIDTIYRMGSS